MTFKGKILIVDDDPVLRRLLVDTLSAIGYETVAASDGVEALEQLRQPENGFNLLVTDVKMPRMDGITLLRKLRRSHPELPVLFITGVVSEEIMAAAAPDGYLSKPFRIARLEEMIENTLASSDSITSPPIQPRVLINVAEDKLRDSLAQAISLNNYLPFAVTGGDEALEELERGRFDAIITGVESGEDAEVVLGKIREKHPRLPMLLLDSESMTQEIHRAGKELGARGYVEQPLNADNLVALLDRTVTPPDNSSN
jgi:CheY-like chemotaxis protein